jgi:phage-related minor tail protein
MPQDFQDEDFREIVIPVRLNTQQALRDMQQLQRLSRRVGDTLSRTFADAIVSGRRFSDVLRGLARQLLHMSITAAMKPLFAGLSGAAGAALSGMTRAITPFARGGIINAPALFAHVGGLGLAGEAGPEAILPLARGPDGRLGVRAAGDARPVQVVMNISTPDAEGFRRNRGRIAAELARAIAEGQRNL